MLQNQGWGLESTAYRNVHMHPCRQQELPTPRPEPVPFTEFTESSQHSQWVCFMPDWWVTFSVEFSLNCAIDTEGTNGLCFPMNLI